MGKTNVAGELRLEPGSAKDISKCVKENVKRLKETIAFSSTREKTDGIYFMPLSCVSRPWWIFGGRKWLDEETMESKVKPMLIEWLLENNYDLLDPSIKGSLFFRVL